MLRPDTRHDSGIQGPGATVRKMTIKPFKQQPKLPMDFEQSTWIKLQSAIHAVHTQTAALQSKEELYRAVEDMCVHKLSARLYQNLYHECEIHINENVDSLIVAGKCSDNMLFLQAFDTVWRNHCEQMNTIRNIFLYLDRTYALQTGGVKAIWDFGLTLFNERLEIYSQEIESKLIVGLLAAVEAERQGRPFDQDTIKRLLRMLVALGQYNHKFHAPFLQDTERFFKTEGQVLIEKKDPAEFLMHVEHRLAEAAEMAKSYLDPLTRGPLQQVIESKLLLPHVALLAEKGIAPLLETHRIADLKRMFLLLERVGASELLKQGWAHYMKTLGENMIADPAREKTLIDDLLQLHDKMDDVHKCAFGSQEAFRVVLKSSFEFFINLKQGRPAELLARFVDKKMKGEKGLGETETETILDRAMSIFRYLQGKDVFEAFYKKLLARRLLLAKSASFELEKSMITKLKTECGSNYTSKLEGMFQDVDLSKDAMTAFTQYIAKLKANANSKSSGCSSRGDIDAHFQVLTIGYWPAPPPSESVRLPPELIASRDRFNVFYNAKYQGRRLMWAHALERCILASHFPKGKKELEVSLYQALVLIGFNKLPRLTFREIHQLTAIEDGELRRTMQSLACGIIGTRVLVKEPKGKDVSSWHPQRAKSQISPLRNTYQMQINDTDFFIFNTDFVNKLFRIKINSIQVSLGVLKCAHSAKILANNHF